VCGCQFSYSLRLVQHSSFWNIFVFARIAHVRIIILYLLIGRIIAKTLQAHTFRLPPLSARSDIIYIKYLYDESLHYLLYLNWAIATDHYSTSELLSYLHTYTRLLTWLASDLCHHLLAQFRFSRWPVSRQKQNKICAFLLAFVELSFYVTVAFGLVKNSFHFLFLLLPFLHYPLSRSLHWTLLPSCALAWGEG